MVITKNKVVSLIYELRVEAKDGEIVEALTEENPLSFLFGSGNLLPKFEENIDGLEVGEKFDFNLTAADAYGDINEAAIVDVPISAFMTDGKLDESLVQIGNTIPMRDSAGNRLNGVVKNVDDSNVKMDFNHPLAGNHLFFTGAVTEIREASEEELMHGHVHGQGGCGGDCSCGSDGEKDSCGSGGDSCGCGSGGDSCGC